VARRTRALLPDDLASRLANCAQLTSDGHKAYLEAVEGVFGCEIDYAIFNKIYETSPEAAKGCGSPAECVGSSMERIEGTPTRCGSMSCRTEQPDDQNTHAPFRAADERVIKEGRKPCLSFCAPHDVFQFRWRSFDAAHVAGGWCLGSSLEGFGYRRVSRSQEAKADRKHVSYRRRSAPQVL
jgi:hypothetical protein